MYTPDVFIVLLVQNRPDLYSILKSVTAFQVFGDQIMIPKRLFGLIFSWKSDFCFCF